MALAGSSSAEGPGWSVPVALLAAVVASGALAACDDAVFEPFQETGGRFSIFGVLDAAADTQWIRVMPVRSQVFTSTEPFDGAVSLEHLGTGDAIILRDSVVAFDAVAVGGGSHVSVRNFWTDEPLEPGATYRFTAEHSDGTETTTLVPLPEDFDVLVNIRNRAPGPNTWNFSDFGRVQVEGFEHLAMVHVVHRVTEDCEGPGTRVYHSYQGASSSRDGVHDVPLDLEITPGSLACPPQPWEIRPELQLVASTRPWPSGTEYASQALGPPGGTSNIENAVGFIGGVVTRTVPWETCRLPDAPSNAYCDLTYDDNAVTLRGTVMDETCGLAVSGADVTLTELTPAAGSLPRQRPVVTSLRGSFQIGAIEPGVSHELHVESDELWPPDQGEFPVYDTYTDTLSFEAGEEVQLDDISLPRRVACPEPSPQASTAGAVSMPEH